MYIQHSYSNTNNIKLIQNKISSSINYLTVDTFILNKLPNNSTILFGYESSSDCCGLSFVSSMLQKLLILLIILSVEKMRPQTTSVEGKEMSFLDYITGLFSQKWKVLGCFLRKMDALYYRRYVLLLLVCAFQLMITKNATF